MSENIKFSITWICSKGIPRKYLTLHNKFFVNNICPHILDYCGELEFSVPNSCFDPKAM